MLKPPLHWLWLLTLVILLTACQATLPQPATDALPAPQLIILNWPDYIPQSVLDAYKAEFGVDVAIVTYDSTDVATSKIHGGLKFDLAILDQEYVAPLIAQGQVVKLDYALLPNARNLSANFRDLVHDPGNVYSIPHTWGTTGLIIRRDLAPQPITRWSDLWDPALAGKIVIRAEPSDVLAIALLTLGLPAWTNDPAQMDLALEQLVGLESQAVFTGDSTVAAVDYLLDGRAAIMAGWSGDALYAREHNATIDYVIPQEGSLFWMERIVISSNSRHQVAAHQFLNFLLRPEIGAQFVNEYYEAIANEAAWTYVAPEIAADPWIFPPQEEFVKANWYPPFDPDTSRLYASTWRRFLASLNYP